MIAVLSIGIILTTDDLELAIRHHTMSEIEYDDLAESTWYAKYQSVQLNDSREAVKEKLGKYSKEGMFGLYQIWKFPYGQVRILFVNDEVRSKQIIVPFLESHDLDETLTEEMNGYTTYDEVISKLGESMEVGKDFDSRTETVNETYVWKLKGGGLIRISFCEGTISDIDVVEPGSLF